jgi:hypothetical protein
MRKVIEKIVCMILGIDISKLTMDVMVLTGT